MSDSVLIAKNLSHSFSSANGEVTPFEDLSFEIQKSKIVAARGESGCGKTTLLLICGGMRSPSKGEVMLDGINLYGMSASARVKFRSQKLGYLFQTLELIPYLSVLQNVKLARGVKDDVARHWLTRLGLEDRMSHKPNALSHGERQRVALARSIAHKPSLLICDEPTGNLDDENAQIVFGALREFADDGGSVLIASHDAAVDSLADEVLSLGKATNVKDDKTTEPAAAIEKPDTIVGAPKPAARTGSVSRLMLFVIGSILSVAALGVAALNLRPEAARSDRVSSQTVRVYCAAGVAKPVEKAIEKYNSQFGGNVEIVRTGGSGELAGQVKTEFETGVKAAADLYLSADDVLLEKAHDDGVIAERFPVAEQRPVIAVRADESRDLSSLQKLISTDDIKYGLASDRAAVGKIVRKIAQREGVLDDLETRKTTDAENVMTLAQALATGSLDAAIIWDTTVNQLNQVDDSPVLRIAAFADESNELKSKIAIGVLSTTSQPTPALKFCRFLSGATDSKNAFEQFGFNFVQGDRWEEVPEVHLYCGSMFTPVLEDSVREFATREGVNIYPRWQGCGKLVASIEGTEDPDLFPDAFLACDISFLHKVENYFEPHTMVSSNDIVIVVRKGYASKIKSPSDLLSGDVRFGICDPQQSALGALTRELLVHPPYEDLYEQIYEKASVIVDVGPTLISQLMAEGLDAAIVYRSNVLADEKGASLLELVEIESERATARQPWAISKQTGNSQLMNRLHEWISRDKIRSRFTQFGFRETLGRKTLD
ncbi:substrate-binding domain-containing protein [Mariniblastus fucicola]|uniref:Putative ABC transporter ATP-binding protein n=1 Tax=Mariniblastus fucicola TaxID=980251 RepID=A0A5B9PRP3_9BACT|nr:substrate-binding domain-containing protein [Mariniblastus fucicola]QEG24933.1 putative ABC transporter ATP-binding protein [Mariniblastus fucicola]